MATQAHPWPYRAYHFDTPLPSPPSASTSSYHQHHHHSRQEHLAATSAQSNNPQRPHKLLDTTYMNPTLPLPPPRPQYTFHSSAHHGLKRSAPEPDDELERSTHISTQFKKLRLNNKQLIPTDKTTSSTSTNPSHPPRAPSPLLNHGAPTTLYSDNYHHRRPHPPTLSADDFMTIDETPNKIYISNLDEEIASIEAAEQSASQLFLPDFEKQIGAIPEHVLRSNGSAYMGRGGGVEAGEGSSTSSQALVLYKEPSSLSVPEEEDAVRKAVSEARRGIRERMRREQQRERETAHIHLSRSMEKRPAVDAYRRETETTVGNYKGVLDDGDAMDIG